MADANAQATKRQRDARQYLAAAPHLKHAMLTDLYRRLAADACALVTHPGRRVRVLDLGAGEGSATLAFLEAGAEVVAVDDDADRLEVLRERADSYRDRLEVHCGDAVTTAADSHAEYDVVSAISFLHHVRDYEQFTLSALGALRPGGVFFSFQDPLLYASLGRGSQTFARIAYLTWRIGRGDLVAGLGRYARRRRHGFDDASPEDAEEFHAQRGGVDHRALLRLFNERGIPVRIVLYFSTQGSAWQHLGASLGLTNSFSLIAGPLG